jgi:hypothetical protein
MLSKVRLFWRKRGSSKECNMVSRTFRIAMFRPLKTKFRAISLGAPFEWVQTV